MRSNIFSQHFIKSVIFGAAFAMTVSFGMAQNVPPMSNAPIQAARKALAAIHSTDMFDDFLPAAARDLKDELAAKNPNLADQISDIVDEQALALAKRRFDLEEEAARIYATYFSVAELMQIAQFYESEAGKKLLKHGPDATRGILGAFDVWRQGIAHDLRVNVAKAMSDTPASEKLVKP